MNLSLKSLEEAKASVESVIQAGYIDQLENGQKFQDEFDDILANINGMYKMCRDIAEAEESLKQGGWSQEWYDSMNKNGNFARICPMDNVPIFGGPDARTNACMEGLGDSLKAFAGKMYEYLTKFFNWLLEKAKWLYGIWRKYLRNAVIERYCQAGSNGSALARNIEKWTENNKAVASRLNSIEVMVPSAFLVNQQQRVIDACFEAVKAADVDPGSPKFQKMIRTAKGITNLKDEDMMEYFRSLVMVKLSERGLQQLDAGVQVIKGVFVFRKIEDELQERTVAVKLNDKDKLINNAVELTRLIQSITTSQRVFADKLDDLNRGIAEIGKRHKDILTGKAGGDAEELVAAVKALSSWARVLASLLKREGELMNSCMWIQRTIAKQLDAGIKAAELAPEVEKSMREAYGALLSVA